MKPILSFPNQSKDFTEGFEAGLIYSKLLDEPEIIETKGGFPVMMANHELYFKMAELLGYETHFSEVRCKGADSETLKLLREQYVDVAFVQKRS